MSFTAEQYAEKIAALLRKAESTKFEAEAETFVAKAQELMTRYAIAEDMVNAARGIERQPIVREQIIYTGIYRHALFEIGAAIARANDCKVFVMNMSWARPAGYGLVVVGHKDDVDRVRMLNASVQIQATGALTRWWADHKSEPQYDTYFDSKAPFRARRGFLFGYAEGLSAILHRGRKAGQEAAVHEDGATADSVALAVRSKEVAVKDWVDENMKLGKVQTGASARGDHASRSAGYDAGQKADVSGRGSVRGGSGGQLGGGS